MHKPADKAWQAFKIAMSNKAAVDRLAKKLATDKWQEVIKKGGKI